MNVELSPKELHQLVAALVVSGRIALNDAPSPTMVADMRGDTVGYLQLTMKIHSARDAALAINTARTTN